jgi:hypothetical protein
LHVSERQLGDQLNGIVANRTASTRRIGARTTMTQFQTIRRNGDGSIDFDLYRTRAVTLRRQAIQDAFRLKAMWGGTLIAAASLTIVRALVSAAMVRV